MSTTNFKAALREARAFLNGTVCECGRGETEHYPRNNAGTPRTVLEPWFCRRNSDATFRPVKFTVAIAKAEKREDLTP